MPPRKYKGAEVWSMYPALHDDVSRLLVDDGLAFDFNPVDSDACSRDYDTNIMGRFECRNPACGGGGGDGGDGDRGGSGGRGGRGRGGRSRGSGRGGGESGGGGKIEKVWTSKRIPITIRLYAEGRYNARVYHQRCKSCDKPSRPHLDGSYAERVAYRLKKWSGVELEPPPFKLVHPDSPDRPPHMRHLCEGCKAGHCTETLL